MCIKFIIIIIQNIYLFWTYKNKVPSSACNVGGPGSIPGSGRSAEEGYPLQYSWPSLVAQLVKNLPATWETWILSLGWEDPLEKGMATHFGILACRIPWTTQSDTKSQTQLSDFHFHF